MIYDACHDQGSSRIKHTDLCRPFHGMGFSCGGSQCTDTWHIKADGKDKGESFCFCEIGGQYSGDICCISGFAPKVELTRLPPVPYRVLRTPNRDSLEIAEAQNARKVSHFSPKNRVTGSMITPIRYKILLSGVPPKP